MASTGAARRTWIARSSPRSVPTRWSTPSISRILAAMTATTVTGRVAEWDGAAAVTLEVVVAAGPAAEADIRAEEVGGEAVAEASAIPRNHTPMVRKFWSGFPKKAVDVSRSEEHTS